jgi:hypothetical protein
MPEPGRHGPERHADASRRLPHGGRDPRLLLVERNDPTSTALAALPGEVPLAQLLRNTIEDRFGNRQYSRCSLRWLTFRYGSSAVVVQLLTRLPL